MRVFATLVFLAFLPAYDCLAQNQADRKKTTFQNKAAPAKDHYLKLSLLSAEPNAAFAWIDSIVYPAKEHSTSSLAATKLRTAYLIENVPSLLNIATPPANSSEQTRAELKFLKELQNKRTPDEAKKYQQLAGIFHSPNNFNPYDRDYDRNFSSLFHIGSPLGDWYNHKNLPHTARFLSDVYRDATYYFFKLKLAINRPRPYHLDTTLKNLERPQHASYPSGHSSASYVNAFIISEIIPELSDSFLKMAAEMAYSREVLGVHYPSDSEIGRVWAHSFVNELFRHQKFRSDFEAAKKEIIELREKINDKADTENDEAHTCCGAGCCSSCCKQ